VLASVTALEEVGASLRKIIEDFHGANPLLPGASKQDLRSRVSAARGEVIDAALEDLAKSDVVVISGDMVRLAGRQIGLSPEEMATKQLIEREFESADLTVPSFAMVLGKLPVETARARRILQILLREKTLVKVTEELVFHRAAIEGLRKRIAGYKLARGERIAVAAFKELTGVSRKYAIPLLEYLDRERVTRRVGDERVIL
jgi:selenocysteine-specific elongation factor